MKFKDWLEVWLHTYKKPYIKLESFERIICVLRYIPDDIKEKELQALKVLELDTIISACKLSRTRKYLYFVITNCLKRAYCLGLINDNIAERLHKVKHKKKTGEALSISEQADFLKAIERSKYKNVLKFYLLTGARRGEALALLWQDIDFTDNIIHIRGTKTEKSDRHFFILPELAEVLKEQRKQVSGEKVFPYKKDNVSHAFKKLCPTHHLHDLRHTFITRCAESGININVCQKLVGHSDITMTLNIYTHVTTEFERREFQKFKI